MEIKTKFNIGDYVYVVHETFSTEKQICDMCLDRRLFRCENTYGDPIITCCDKCKGQDIYRGSTKYIVSKLKIEGLSIYIDTYSLDNYEITYWGYINDNPNERISCREERIFIDKNQALAKSKLENDNVSSRQNQTI